MTQDLYPDLQTTNVGNESCAPCLRSAKTRNDETTYSVLREYLEDLWNLSTSF